MKPSKYTFFTSLLCASGLSAGLCFCVMTSFAVPADGLSLVCACILAALLFSALLLLPKSWIWLLAMAALAGGGLYILRAQLIESISALVAAVTQQYSEAIPGIQTVHLTDTSGAVPDHSADASGGLGHFARCRRSCAASSDAAAPRTAGRRGEPAGAAAGRAAGALGRLARRSVSVRYL